MPQRYKVLTGLIALSGSLTLIFTGELNPVYYPFLFLMIYGYIRLIKNKPQGSRFIIGLSSIAGLFIFFIDVFIITGDYLVSVGHLSLIFHAIKSFDIKEPYDPLQVYFMALLQLVVASEFTTQMLFGAIIILFVFLFIFVMIMAHYIKTSLQLGISIPLEARGLKNSLILLVIITFVLSTVFFISLPRLRYGLWGKSHIKGIKNAGFSERMDLSSGELKLDPTVVMRVELRPFIKAHYYWRGMTLDYFDGRAWSNSFIETRKIIKKTGEEFLLRTPIPEDSIEQDILLEPVDSELIFLMDRPVSINITAHRLERDFSDTIYLPKKGARRIHYIARSSIQLLPEDKFHLQYLQIPPSLEESLKPFTERLVSRIKSDRDKALLIESFLKNNYTYSLTVTEPPSGVDPVSYFLFEEKKGYCEHYASAMVLMLRSIGIPARVVTGFSGGQINEIGNYIIVRQKDAHSWVEALIDGRWLRFDPTPSETISEPAPPGIFLYLDYLKLKWQRYVVSFSREDQKKIIGGIKRSGEKIRIKIEDFIISATGAIKRAISIVSMPFLFVIMLSIVILSFLFFKITLLKRPSYQEVSLYYVKLKKLLKEKGFPLGDSSTPLDVFNYGLLSGLPKEELEEFIELYLSARFGEKKTDLKHYRGLFSRLKRTQR
ncbi:MAG: transglutaminaseTgpA domain-containing protein [Thermodesulfovibrionales bacterium]